MEYLEWVFALLQRSGVADIFQDDEMYADRKRCVEIFEELKKRKYDLIWKNANLPAWKMDYDLIKLMKESGCYQITISPESGSDRVLKEIIHKPGKKDYGILSVISQSFAACKKLFDVPRGNFIPPPEVTSTVIMMDFENSNYKIDDEDHFKKVIKAAFGKRRKTIRNSLLGAKFKTEVVDASLSSSGINPKRRAETLSVEEYIELAGVL